MRRYPLAIYAGITFSLALAASAVYWDATRVVLGPDSSWATIATLNAEYREATGRLTLPEGHAWPARLPYQATDSDGVPNTYASGVGTEWAEWYWFDTCAKVAVAAAESTSTREAAIARLPEFYQTTAFTTSAERGYFRTVIDSAQTGDLTALREYVGMLPDATEYEEATP